MLHEFGRATRWEFLTPRSLPALLGAGFVSSEEVETAALLCQEGHGITQTFGKQGGAQGSWQPHRDQHTNATTTTSLLFLEE